MYKKANSQKRNTTQQKESNRSSDFIPYLPWIAAVIPLAVHLGWLFSGIFLTRTISLAEPFTQMAGTGIDLTEWLIAYTHILVPLGFEVQMAVLFSIWVLIWVAFSITAALMQKEDLLAGVLTFLSQTLAAIILAAVITPCLWIIAGRWGSTISPAAAPLVFSGVTLFLSRKAFLTSDLADE